MRIEKDGIRYGIVRAHPKGVIFIPSKHLKGTPFYCESFVMFGINSRDFNSILGYIEKIFQDKGIQIGRS